MSVGRSKDEELRRLIRGEGHASGGGGRHADVIVTRAAGPGTLGPEVVTGPDAGSFSARVLEAALLVERFVPVQTSVIRLNPAGQTFQRGQRKTDPRDGRTTGDLVRSGSLRPIPPDDDPLRALRLKLGCRREASRDQTGRISRLLGLLCSIHPGLGQTLHLPYLVRTRYAAPVGIRRPRKASLRVRLRKTRPPRGTGALVDPAPEAARPRRIVEPGEAPPAELLRGFAAETLDAPKRIGRI